MNKRLYFESKSGKKTPSLVIDKIEASSNVLLVLATKSHLPKHEFLILLDYIVPATDHFVYSIFFDFSVSFLTQVFYVINVVFICIL
jgi:hypothetical protein